MLDLYEIDVNKILQLFQNYLNTISEEEIIQFSKSIFPVHTIPDCYKLFYHNLSTFYTIRINKKQEFSQISKELLKKAKDFGQNIFIAIESLYKNQQFIDAFTKRMTKVKVHIKTIQKPPPQEKVQKDNTERIVVQFSSNQFKNSSVNTSISDNRSVSSNDSLKIPSATFAKTLIFPTKEFKRQPLVLASNKQTNNISKITQSATITNLSDQDMCFCGKHVSLIQSSKEPFFQCIHCTKKYHTDCMKRSIDSKTCTFCHLRKLIPTRQTKKTLFVGLLHKGRRRHEINMYFTEEDLSIQFKIQVRSFRIKEGCQTAVLFQDSVNFIMRNLIIKEFLPLHKQSSLKYRKDEPFYITNGLPFRQNKLIITEKHPNRQSKDERIQLQTHLLGVYLIEQKKVDWLVREVRTSCYTQFVQSKALLQNQFKLGSVGDQIECEMVKIPLICSLTTQKLKYPVRGVFCTHYQCFDLKNYLQLTSGSSNPRWLCPLCKLPAYQFKIDVILNAALQLHKQNQVTQLTIIKNGQFIACNSQGKVFQSHITNIFDLPIDEKYKQGEISRFIIGGGSEQPMKKRKKVEIVLG